jgi:hypothetical protein
MPVVERAALVLVEAPRVVGRPPVLAAHRTANDARADAAVDGKRVVVDLRDRRPDARVRAVAAPADEAPTALEIVDRYSRGPRRDHRADGAPLDDLRQAVTTLVETERTARRVLGGAHPLTPIIDSHLQNARAALRARETQPPSDNS